MSVCFNFKEYDWGDLRSIFGLAILLLVGIAGTLFYWKNLNTIIIVDKTGINLEKNNITIIHANWEEINKVDLVWLLEEFNLGGWALLFPKASFIIKIYLKTMK